MASENYVEWVSKLTAQGFTKITVINKSYQCVGASATDAVPAAWNSTEEDADGKKTTKMINENQELANDWSKTSTFYFFKTKFRILQKSSTHLCGASSPAGFAIVARDIKNVWVIAMGPVAGASVAKKAKKSKSKGAKPFPNPPGAYNKACTGLFDDLEEDE